MSVTAGFSARLAARLTGADFARVVSQRESVFAKGLSRSLAQVKEGRIAVYESPIRAPGLLARLLPRLPSSPPWRFSPLGPLGAVGVLVLSGAHKSQVVEELVGRVGPEGPGVARARLHWVFHPAGGVGVDLFRAAVLGPPAPRQPHGSFRGMSRSHRERFVKSFSSLLLGAPETLDGVAPGRPGAGQFAIRYLCSLAWAREEERLNEVLDACSSQAALPQGFRREVP